MRADYGLYILAIICFAIAGLVLLNVAPQYLPEPATFEATAFTVIFTALGLIFVVLGYALRPKPIISVMETAKPAPPLPPPPAQPPTETTATQPSEPAPPTPPREETAKAEEKPKAGRRRTKKRRKKA